MKRFLVLATAAVAMFTGCTKQFVDEPVNGSQSTVGFDTYIAGPTKGVAKGGFVMGDQFFVYGGKTGALDFNVAAPAFTSWVFSDAIKFPKDGALVSNYGGTPTVWRYENPVSWDNEKVTFFGFSPVPQGTDTYGIKYEKPANLTSIPTIDFEVKGGYDVAKSIKDQEAIDSRPLTKQQVDLLWVSTLNQTKANRTVEMLFNHALTRLNFAIRSNAPVGHSIRINSIVLKNVATEGTLTLAHDRTQVGNMDYVGGWAVKATKKNFAVNLINSVASLIKDNNIHTITDNDEALMLIPQALAGIELEVLYAYSADGINWENYETGVPVTVKLGELAATHWNPNKQIRYILNITPGEVIGFSAEIEDWGDESDVEFISKWVGQNAQELVRMTLVAGDRIESLTDDGWLTYQTGAGAASDLSTTAAVAVDGEYIFAVKDNNEATPREDQIIINHLSGHRTIIKVNQAEGTGNNIIDADASAGEILNVTLAAGDKISVPQTKADATWVLVNGSSISTEFTTEGKASISLEPNTFESSRAATFEVTIGGKATSYTITQKGVTFAAIAANDAEGAITGLGTVAVAVGDKIVSVDGGIDWVFVTGTALTKTAIGTSLTIADAEDVAISVATNTGSPRTAKFITVLNGVVAGYEVNQAGGTTTEEIVAASASGDPAIETVNLAAGDKISGVASTWISIDGTVFDGTTIDLASDKGYDVGVRPNTTGAERTGEITVVKAGATIKYTVKQPAATYTAVAATAEGAVFNPEIPEQSYTTGDKIIPVDGSYDWIYSGASSFTSELNLSGLVEIHLSVNQTTTVRTGKFITVIADVVTGYEITQDASTVVTLATIPAIGGASTDVVALVAGDEISHNGQLDGVAKLVSPGSVQEITLNNASEKVTEAGDWTVEGINDNTGAGVKTGKFWVIKSDGSVNVYNVTQAED